MGHLDLTAVSDYRRFLAIQLAARGPIEGWIADHCAVPFRPPIQSNLIRADLSALGGALAPPPDRPFRAAPEGALGVAWALGGSSLGNRAMLARMRKRGSDLPTAFLADPAMPAYFVRIRPSLDRDSDGYADLDAAISAAGSVFAAFTAAFEVMTMKRAA